MDNKDGELEVYAKETIRNDGKKWIIYDTDVHNSLTKWKQERVQPRTDLAFYDIIDISPGSNSGFVQSLPRDVVHEIRRSKSLSTPNMDNIDGMKDYIIDFIKKKNFRNYVDESYMKTRINNTTKFIWDYLNFLVESFERDNDLADYNLSELGGEKCLFASSEDRNQEKNDKEDRNAGRKVDIIWSMKPTDLEFFVGEVSGPPNQRNHTHFFNDKIKIAKMLKVIFNRVVKKYGGAGMSLSLLKLYGLHVYYNEVIIYEMSIPFRGLYVFCEVLQSKLPTNKVEVGLILRSASVLLKFKGLLEKSLTDLKDYIQDACTQAILFIQKGVLTSPINNLKTQESDVNIGNDKGGRELAQLFSDAEIAEGKMVEAKQKEIICWYTYREAYQNSVAEIQSKTGIAEKTAKTQVYIMIKASLPKVSDVNLYKKTQRAGTIYKLFGKIIDPITQKEVKGIGIDKAYGISYGAKSISELTNVQILNIIKQD
ncbi:16587_t:CDS:2 [Entrophospora sp. SA101]|nr:16587_t:CDS:2 [Entrophospora sp. SA101]